MLTQPLGPHSQKGHANQVEDLLKSALGQLATLLSGQDLNTWAMAAMRMILLQLAPMSPAY